MSEREMWDAEADGFDEVADHGLSDPAIRAAWRDLLIALLPPTPAEVLRRWSALLRPGGRLVLIEGHWSTGAGLRSEQLLRHLVAAGRDGEVTRLPQARYWGREITDDRYALVSIG